MDGAKIKIIDLFFDKDNFIFSLNLNLWVLLLLFCLFLVVWYLVKKYKEKSSVDKDVKLVKLKYKIGGTDFEYEITRDYQNIEIAHKIYIELIVNSGEIDPGNPEETDPGNPGQIDPPWAC